MLLKNYKATLAASCLGYVTQAIMLNFPPLLFVLFQEDFGLTIAQVSTLIASNFITELAVDAIASKYAQNIGYRPLVILADIFSILGLVAMFALPSIMTSKYLALIISMMLCGLGGGLMEVLISPIVEACPTKDKSGTMSLLHSFYCWGQVAVVLLSTIFFKAVGIESWHYIALIWALVPLIDLILFTIVPINTLVEKDEESKLFDLFKSGFFWVMIVMMLCAGACELAMSQWASAFAESALGVEKWLGDLLGPCLFAVAMGSARVFYARSSEKINLEIGILISAIICIFSYLLAIFAPLPIISLIGCALCGIGCGLLWPGSYSIAIGKIPKGGVLLFGLLALAGDLGALVGPFVAGQVSSAFGDNLKAGFFASLIFPSVLTVICIFLIIKNKKKQD